MNTRKLSLLLAVVLTVGVAAGAHAAPGIVGGVKLKGVDPAVYMQKRNHKPDVVSELRKLPADVAIAVLADPRAFLADEAGYPAGLKPEAIAALRDTEVRALLQGALSSLALRKDDQAFEVLQRHTQHADIAVAAVAAERLGLLDDHRVVGALAAIAADDARITVAAAAAAGLGNHRSENSLDALVQLLSSSSPEVRVAAVRAIGSLTSRWAWEARADTATGNQLRARALPAVQAVKGNADVVAARDEILRLMR